MTSYYDQLRGRQRFSSLPTIPGMAGAGSQYPQMPGSSNMIGGQPLGGAPILPFGAHRAMTHPAHLAAANQQYAQQQYMNQVPQAAPIYGSSPAAQYIAATQAA